MMGDRRIGQYNQGVWAGLGVVQSIKSFPLALIIIIIIIYLFKVGVIKVVKKLINANHLTKTKMERKNYLQ